MFTTTSLKSLKSLRAPAARICAASFKQSRAIFRGHRRAPAALDNYF